MQALQLLVSKCVWYFSFISKHCWRLADNTHARARTHTRTHTAVVMSARHQFYSSLYTEVIHHCLAVCEDGKYEPLWAEGNLCAWIIIHLCVSICLEPGVLAVFATCPLFPINHTLFRNWNSQSGAFFFPVKSGGERTHFSVPAAYISTQRGNGHENRLKPKCNGKFIPLWPWTHQASREIHWRFFFKICRKSFSCVYSGDVAEGMKAW